MLAHLRDHHRAMLSRLPHERLAVLWRDPPQDVPGRHGQAKSACPTGYEASDPGHRGMVAVLPEPHVPCFVSRSRYNPPPLGSPSRPKEDYAGRDPIAVLAGDPGSP